MREVVKVVRYINANAHKGMEPIHGEYFNAEWTEMMLTAQPSRYTPPYQRLLGDALRGNGEMFGRQDLIDAQWRIVEGILDNTTPLYT